MLKEGECNLMEIYENEETENVLKRVTYSAVESFS